MVTGSASVAVVIPCFGQARFLAGAIESALAQSDPPREIIVVSDGDQQDLSPIVAAYSGVLLLTQTNQGLAAARNAGLRKARSDKIVFLDADDRLLPDALAAGLRCFEQNDGVAFAYGAFDEERPGGVVRRLKPIKDRLDLIRCNWVAMIATVMFDRAKLLDLGGFDETLGMCEDWDAYLRLSRQYEFAAHDQPVAVYHRHGESMSADTGKLRYWIDQVRSREQDRGLDERELRAWREGEHVWEKFYGAAHPASLLTRARRKLSRFRLGL